MARSATQKALRSRQNELRKHFLPRRFSKTGSYDDAQRHMAGAYRIFFCSELEHYFEEIARSVARHSESQWGVGKTTKAFAAICSRNSKQINMPQESVGVLATSYLDRRFKAELEVIRKTINENNGAKSHNILAMFVPLGINESLIDNVLLSECDTLGSGRGFLAHSTAGAAVYLIDPRTEYDHALKILRMLDQFELLLTER